MELEKGKRLFAEDKRQVVIEKCLSNEGGSADIYLVNVNGEKLALKWFKLDNDRYGGNTYSHIRNDLIPTSPPAPNFCWPISIVTVSDSPGRGDEFGYIMPLKPGDFYEMKYFLQGSDKSMAKSFVNQTARLTACIEIAYAIRKLHAAGMCYQDLNQGNFCFNPVNGNVYILDVDPIIVDEKMAKTTVKGMRGYMAPEIPRSQYRAHPSTLTDYYSMAVILYRLMFVDHPMEGRKCAAAPMWTDASEEEMYELHPTFCFDPRNAANRPNSEWAANAGRRWNFWPQELHDKFIRSFTEGVDNPQKRVTENEWIATFSNVRDLMIDVPNRGSTVVDFTKPETVPPMCLKMTNTNKRMPFGEAAIYHGKAFTMHTITNNTQNIHDPAMYVYYDQKSGKFAARNYSKERWNVYDPSRKQGSQTFPCDPGSSFICSPGVQIQFRVNDKVNLVGVISDPRAGR